MRKRENAEVPCSFAASAPDEGWARCPRYAALPLAVLAAVLTIYAGSKNPKRGSGGARRASAVAGTVPRQPLPDDIATNAYSITDFEIDQAESTVRFSVRWAEGLFDYTLTRNLYFYASTNLGERQWALLGAFPVPIPAVSPYALTVAQTNVFEAMRPRFLDTFDGIGFYRFDIDLDSDGDGLSDSQESGLGTDPHLEDTDGDGLLDDFECTINSNPLQPDSDSDGMNDGWEYQHRNAGFNPSVDNAVDANPDNDFGADPDGDSLTNGQECEWNTNPSGMDEDEDGVADGYDTDGDGVNDGAEVGQYSDPRDGGDEGVANSRVPVPFYFGDPSSSCSEKYRLEVLPVSGIDDTPLAFAWLNANYGQCESRTAMLKPGWTYEVRQKWASCRYPLDGVSYPNYDYTLSLGQNVPRNVALDDPDNLFRTDYYGSAYYGASHFPVLDAVANLRVYAVTDVVICAPNALWSELDESRVLLDAEDLYVRIEVRPQLTSLVQCRQLFGDSVTIMVDRTRPARVSVPIPDDAIIVNSPEKSEILITKTCRQLKSLGILPQDGEDGVDEMSVYDAGTIIGNKGSNLSDSYAFAALAFQWRGNATNEMSLDLYSTPPNARLSKSFFQAAGSETIEVAYGGKTSARKQIMNQADYFYYSGHGLHKFAIIDDDIEPSDVGGFWTNDLDCVIIAGCSVLDINDYNNNFILDPQDHVASPGKLWATVGPVTMLGYNYIAPLDETGAPARIIGDWVRLRSSHGDVDAWMKANDNRNGRNACTIERIDDLHVRYSYFKREKGFLYNSYLLTNVIERIAR